MRAFASPSGRAGILALALCLLGSDAVAQRVRQELPRFFRHFRSYNVYENLTRAVLESGLTVVVEEHPTSALAAVVTSVRLGWIDTRSSDSRVLAERLLFVLDESISRLGGVSEYRLDEYSTEFHSVVPADEVGHAVRAHLRLLRLEETDFELERSRVAGWVEEHRARPGHRLRDEMCSAVFDEACSLESPFEVSDEDLIGLHRAYFHPGNVVLAVAGAVRREGVLRRVSDEVAELGPIAVGDRGAYGAAGEPESFPGLVYRQGATTLDYPVLLMGFRGPGPGHPDYRILELVRYLLAEGHAALLRLSRPEESPPPVEVSGYLEATPGGGLLWFATFPGEGLLERSEVRFLAVVEALGRAGPPESLLGRAKALMVVDGLRRLENLSTRASALADAEARGDLRGRDALPEKIAAISAGDVQRVVRKYLHPDNLSVVELRPPGTSPRAFTPETYRETLDILVPAEVEGELALLASFSGDEFEEFRPPAFSPNYSSAELRRSSILRGPEIYLREHHALPLVHLGFFFPGGRISEQPDKAGITGVLLRAVLNHHARRDGGREILALEADGVRIGPVNEPDFFGYRISALSPAVHHVSRELVGWIRSNPELTGEDLEAARTAARLAADMECGALEGGLGRAGNGVFGGHPYGFGDRESCKNGLNFSLEDLEQWREVLIQGVNPYILVSGDVRGTSFLQDHIDRLSDPRFENRRAVSRRVEGTEEASSVEPAGTRTLLAFLGPGADSYYVEMLDVAAAVLGGPSGLATRKLREKKLGYEVRLVQRNLVQAGLVILEVHSPAGRREAAAKAALAEVRSFSESPAELSRFYAALVKTITGFMVRQSDPDAYLVDTMTAVLATKPPDYARRYILNVKQMRMGEVETAIRRFLGGVEE
jgi:predicted Zn-dependent peptidase